MKGAFITNRYYTDSGMEYAYTSLKQAFKDIPLTKQNPLLVYDSLINKKSFDFDFAVFYDKDFYLAQAIEKCGIRVFNNSSVLSVCDDKQKTYLALKDILIPKTISAPLVYDVNTPHDIDFLNLVEKSLGFPLVVKANTGSQGRQVFLAEDRQSLDSLYKKMQHTPHHYQRLTGKFGSDIRLYTVAKKVIAACARQGTGFRSNLVLGGKVSLIAPDAKYIQTAESIAEQLNLDFGAVDFLIDDRPVFLEVNSNAYFTGIQKLGVDIAGKIASYIKNSLGIK